MAKKTSDTNKIIAIVLIVLGVGLAFWGYQQSGSLGSQFNEVVSGSPSDNVMMFYIGGVVSFAVGMFLLLKK